MSAKKKTEWVDIPSDSSGLDNLPDSVCWNDKEILLKYNSDDNDPVTIKLQNQNYSDFEEIVNYIKSREYLQLFAKLSTMVTESDSKSQWGSFNRSISSRFKYYCDECDEKTTFQLKGRYRGLHAGCTCCGSELSVIRNRCNNCSKESIFVKPRVDASKFYECYECHSELP